MSTNNIFTNDEYEHDPRWTAVDAYSVSHLHPPSRPNAAILTSTLENIRDNGVVDDSTYPAFGKFLALQCQAARAKHVLEVGLLGGYTSIWITTQNPGTRVTALELNEKHIAVARQNFEMAGVSDRVEILQGPGVKSFQQLEAEVNSGSRPKFDFVFIDADKENNWAYFDAAVKISVPGTCIIVDNVVRKGNLVLEEARDQVNVHGARQVVEEVGKDSRVEACVMQTVCEKNYDGFLMAIVK